MLDKVQRFWGLQTFDKNVIDKLATCTGTLLCIYLTMLICHAAAGSKGAAFIVPSMGASAILLFAVPHGPLSQPWPVIGGHVLAAAVGVLSAKLIANPIFAGAVAVSAAIALMYLARCVHPPGGATALAAVVSAAKVQSLGFHYVLFPVFANCLVIVTLAVLFNNCFSWRRYPVSLMPVTQQRLRGQSGITITETHILDAIQAENVLVEGDWPTLARVLQTALQLADLDSKTEPCHLHVGGYYTNGDDGVRWAVRQIVEERPSDQPEHDLVIYEVVEGEGVSQIYAVPRAAFVDWAKSELLPRWEYLREPTPQP